MTKLLTAICFDFNNKAYKYRRIQNKDSSINRFESFCRTKSIKYVNYYDKETRRFLRQKKIEYMYNPHVNK